MPRSEKPSFGCFFRIAAWACILLPFSAAAATYNPQSLDFGASGLTSLAWSLDGSRVAACALSGPCRVWDAATGKALATAVAIGPAAQQSDAIGFSPNGRTLAIPIEGGLTIWGWADGVAPRNTLFPANYAHTGSGFDALHNCGGAWLETTGDNKTGWALTLDPKTFTVTHAAKLPAFGLDPACLPGAGLIAPDGGATPAQLLALQDGRVTQQINATFHETPFTPYFQTTAVAAAPNGKLIAVGAELEDEAKLPDGSWVSVTAPFSVRLVSWPANHDEGGLFPNNTYVFTLSFSPDSRYLAASLNHQVAVQLLGPGGAAKFLTAPDDGYTPIMFSPRQNILAVGAGNRVLLFDMKNVFGG